MLEAKDELRHYLECLGLDTATRLILLAMVGKMTDRQAQAFMTAFQRAEEIATDG